MSIPPAPRTWSRLVGALADSLDPKALLLAVLCLGLLKAGWGGLDLAFAKPATSLTVPEVGTLSRGLVEAPRKLLVRAGMRLAVPARAAVAPWAEVFSRGGDRLHALIAGLWSLVVLSLMGGAIGRVLIVRAADEFEAVGLRSALDYALRRAGSLLAAPLCLLIAAGLIALPGLAVGILMGSASPTLSGLASALGFVPLIGGLALAVLLVGLAAGWPLMVLTVAAEGEDGFDAVSRAYSYLGHQPLRFAALLLLAIALGVVGLLAIDAMAALTLHMARWSVSLFSSDPPRPFEARSSWGQVVGWGVAAWPFSYFWAAASRIYLVLRGVVDGAPWDDFHRPEREAGLDPMRLG